jgi:hypothetical protein
MALYIILYFVGLLLRGICQSQVLCVHRTNGPIDKCRHISATRAEFEPRPQYSSGRKNTLLRHWAHSDGPSCSSLH